MDMFKKASKSVYTSTIVVSPAPSSPTPSTSSVTKTPENIDKDPNEPEPVAEGDIQIHYSSD
jgi:hypothetical protein